MNKKKLLELADKIEKVSPKNFDMAEWATGPINRVGLPNLNPGCETTCCIAGWQQVLQGRYLGGSRVYSGFTEEAKFLGYAEDLAREDLGLNGEEVNRLFYTSGWPHDEAGFRRYPNTPAGAAKRIRDFVDGVV